MSSAPCTINTDPPQTAEQLDRVVNQLAHIHEPLYMVEGEVRPTPPGMCFAVDPGIYLPGRLGVRIEDIVVMTQNGGHRCINSSRDMASAG